MHVHTGMAPLPLFRSIQLYTDVQGRGGGGGGQSILCPTPPGICIQLWLQKRQPLPIGSHSGSNFGLGYCLNLAVAAGSQLPGS